MHGNPGELVPHHVTKTASQNQHRIGIDAGSSMVSKIVALVPVMNISIMLRGRVIISPTINVLQYASGASGLNGVHAIQIVNRAYEYEDAQIMKILKERFNF